MLSLTVLRTLRTSHAGMRPGADQPGSGPVRDRGPADRPGRCRDPAQRVPASGFGRRTGGDAGSGGVHSHQRREPAGAGDRYRLQISVSWDADSDVDLHVVDPSGDEIYWNSMSVASGGVLDLDSNPNCDLDNTRNENVTFTDAPRGDYTVRVDYYEACGVEETNYVVTVQLPNGESQVFEGRFTGDRDRGAAGSGERITSFTMDG